MPPPAPPVCGPPCWVVPLLPVWPVWPGSWGGVPAAETAPATGTTARPGGTGRHDGAAVALGGGRHGIRPGAGEAGDERRGEDDGHGPRVHPPGREDEQGGRHADREHRDAEPVTVGRRAREEDEAPRRGGRGRGGEGDGGDGARAALPGLDRTHADEGTDRRGEGHGVVLVEDAGHEREDEHRDDEPATPDEVGRAAQVGARATAPQPRPAASRMSALGMSHEIWSPTLEENIRNSPVEPHMPPPCAAAAAAADRAGLVAAEAAETVVAEGQLEEEFVWLPPMYGRAEAGTSSTIATHQPADSTMVPTARSEWTIACAGSSGRR